MWAIQNSSCACRCSALRPIAMHAVYEPPLWITQETSRANPDFHHGLLGAVLYEMVSGKRAFEGRSRLSVASAILEKQPAPICTVKPMTPLTLEHAIRRCLSKSPGDRWQSAADLKC